MLFRFITGRMVITIAVFLVVLIFLSIPVIDAMVDFPNHVGLYDPGDGVFHLLGEEPFRYGPRDSTWLPLAGDWDESGAFDAGLYDPGDGVFHLLGEEPFHYGPRDST